MSTVMVDLGQYVSLLIRAECTDAEQWPAEVRSGAELLARIRAREKACREAHGEWNWELLSEDEQLDYDSDCAALDALRRALDPSPGIPLSQYLAEREIELA